VCGFGAGKSILSKAIAVQRRFHYVLTYLGLYVLQVLHLIANDVLLMFTGFGTSELADVGLSPSQTRGLANHWTVVFTSTIRYRASKAKDIVPAEQINPASFDRHTVGHHADSHFLNNR